MWFGSRGRERDWGIKATGEGNEAQSGFSARQNGERVVGGGATERLRRPVAVAFNARRSG